MEPTLFDTPFNKALKSVRKYSPDQPRDEKGQWTAGGVARAIAGGAALAGAVALGVASRGNATRAMHMVQRHVRRAGTSAVKPIADTMQRSAFNLAHPLIGGYPSGVAQRDAIRQARAQLRTIAANVGRSGGGQRAGAIGGQRLEGMAARIRSREPMVFNINRRGSPQSNRALFREQLANTRLR